jgi:hypothetical protein
MKSFVHLIKYALSNNATVSVMDEEGWLLKTSVKYTDIIKAIESVEECTLRFRDAEKNVIGSAYITPFEDDDCTVCDYSCTPFMEQWNELYNLTTVN